MNIDGSKNDDAAWYGTAIPERRWREVAWTMALRQPGVVDTDVVSRALESPHWLYAARYLEPSDLCPPWTPALIGHVHQINDVVKHYDFYDGIQEEAGTLTMGERIFKDGICAFTEVGCSRDD